MKFILLEKIFHLKKEDLNIMNLDFLLSDSLVFQRDENDLIKII